MVDETTTPLRDVMKTWLARAQERQNTLTKPPGSLGRLEEIANRICAIQQTLSPNVDQAAILVFAGDHGVCEEGVNPFPQSVTRQMLQNFLSRGAAINALAAAANAQLIVVDTGVVGHAIEHPQLLSRRIAEGTRNFCKCPAMSREQLQNAIETGQDCARQANVPLLGIGEMGIGNSTVASAICAALTGLAPELVCGLGTGSDGAGLARKREAVRTAVRLHRDYLQHPLDLLARLGGFEIAAMCGVCLAAPAGRFTVLVDGFISTAAACVAVRIDPAVRDFLIASHRSVEPGHRMLLDLLQLEPLLDLHMRLGEGTGAALAIPIVRAAVAAFNDMATFASAAVSEAQ